MPKAFNFYNLKNLNGCNIPTIKGATPDKPSEMMDYYLSIRKLGFCNLLFFL